MTQQDQPGTVKRLRLLLVDDHMLFRESLARLLACESDFEVAGDCGTAAEALDILRLAPVDVVLLDFDLDEHLGSQFILSARESGYSGKILVVAAEMNAKECSEALKLDASGIFFKHNSPLLLAKAIRIVAVGEMWVDERVIRLMADSLQRTEDQTFPKSLSGREREVLTRILEGLTNKEIAGNLGVTETAVKAALQQLFRKTGVRTRSQLVRIAIETSILTARKKP